MMMPTSCETAVSRIYEWGTCDLDSLEGSMGLLTRETERPDYECIDNHLAARIAELPFLSTLTWWLLCRLVQKFA